LNEKVGFLGNRDMIMKRLTPEQFRRKLLCFETRQGLVKEILYPYL
jgi:hypothetical protein